MAKPTRLGQIAHLAAQAWYLARNSGDHPVLADNRVWYQGRSASLYTLVRDPAAGGGPLRLRLTLAQIPTEYHWDLALIYDLRMARPGDVTRTRFDLLDLKYGEGFEIKPDNPRQIRAGKADLSFRLEMLNAESMAPPPSGMRAALQQERWSPTNWKPGSAGHWNKTGVYIPIGIKRWAVVRFVPSHPGVLAWRIVRSQRRRTRQPRIASLRQMRTYVAAHLQTAPPVTIARLMVGLAEAAAVAVVGRQVVARANAAVSETVGQGERAAAREILERVADTARRAPGRAGRGQGGGGGTRGVPPAWRLPPGGPGGWPRPPAGGGMMALPLAHGMTDYLAELAGDAADGLGSVLAAVGEAIEWFDELEELAVDLLLFPLEGIDEETALVFMHREPFFGATRHLGVETRERQVPTPRLQGDAGDGGRRPDRRRKRAAATGVLPGGTPATEEEQALEEDMERMRGVAELVAAMAPYAAPLNSDPYYFQVDIWRTLLGSLVEALGSADAVFELFGLAPADPDDAVAHAILAEAFARDPDTITAWAVFDWLLFEEEEVFEDMLASTGAEDFDGDDGEAF
jgi:hypothetical protein